MKLNAVKWENIILCALEILIVMKSHLLDSLIIKGIHFYLKIIFFAKFLLGQKNFVKDNKTRK